MTARFDDLDDRRRAAAEKLQRVRPVVPESAPGYAYFMCLVQQKLCELFKDPATWLGGGSTTWIR